MRERGVTRHCIEPARFRRGRWRIVPYRLIQQHAIRRLRPLRGDYRSEREAARAIYLRFHVHPFHLCPDMDVYLGPRT